MERACLLGCVYAVAYLLFDGDRELRSIARSEVMEEIRYVMYAEGVAVFFFKCFEKSKLFSFLVGIMLMTVEVVLIIICN